MCVLHLVSRAGRVLRASIVFWPSVSSVGVSPVISPVGVSWAVALSAVVRLPFLACAVAAESVLERSASTTRLCPAVSFFVAMFSTAVAFPIEFVLELAIAILLVVPSPASFCRV